MISDTHPLYQAQLIAQYLDNDPILARQVKEHISEERLLELFEIKPEVVIREAEEALLDAVCDSTPSEILKVLLDRFSEEELADMAKELAEAQRK